MSPGDSLGSKIVSLDGSLNDPRSRTTLRRTWKASSPTSPKDERRSFMLDFKVPDLGKMNGNTPLTATFVSKQVFAT